MMDEPPGNGTEAAAEETPQPIMWRKGAPRTEAEASACDHLVVACLATSTMHREPRKGVVLPHEDGFTSREVGLPVQPLSLVCSSADVINMARSGLKREQASVLMAVSVTLDICKLCPYWRMMRV
jgi:hypothetical protein